jgi:hypothetical protein
MNENCVASSLTGTFSSHDWIEELQSELNQVQAAHVDDPRAALEHAHDLIAQVVAHQERSGNDDDAEELAAVLARYRDFHSRLVSATSEPS